MVPILVAFLCRISLYTTSSVVAVSVKGLETESVRSLVIACLQIMVVACVATLYQTCSYLLQELKNVTGYKSMDVSDLSLHDTPSTTPEKEERPAEGLTYAQTTPAPELRSMSDVELRPTSMRHLPEIQANIDFLSRADSPVSVVVTPTPVTHETASNHESWKFATSSELQWYIIRVHMIGFVLWSTVIGLDFTHPSLIVAFTTGLCCGVMMSRGNSDTKLKYSSMISCVFFLHGVLFTVVLSACFRYTVVQWKDPSHLVMLLLVILTGLLWGVQSPSPRILSTAHSAFITTTLMSVPILFLLSTLNDIDYLVHRDATGSLYVLVLEPILKFLNIYALVISIKTNRGLEVCAIITSIMCFVLVSQHTTIDSMSLFDVVGCLSATALLVLHLVYAYFLRLQ